MIIQEIYFGYINVNNKFCIDQMVMDNKSLKKVSDHLKIRKTSNRSFEEAISNMDSSKKDFYIKTEPNIYKQIISNVISCIRSNPTKIQNVYDKNKKIPYDFIIYLGRNNNTSNDIVGVIFEFKNSFTTKKTKFFVSFTVNGKTKSTLLPQSKYFQLPLDKNISTFFITQENDDDCKYQSLHIFQPNEFDKLFKTKGLEKKFAEKNMKKFNENKFLITNDNIQVSFVSNDLRTNDFSNICSYVKSEDDILEDISSYSGNGNSTIKKISKNDLSRVIKQLNDEVKYNKSCKFEKNNIPKIIGNKLCVSHDSVPIFSALLNNRIILKLLSNEIKIPFFDDNE